MLKLRELRIEKNLTQQAMSKEIGVSRQVYSNWENEINQPDYNFLVKLADFFGVSTDYLLGRSDELGYVTIQSSPTVPALSANEQKLLNNFRAMRPDLQAYYLKMSETLIQTPDEIAGNNQKKKA